MSDTAKKEKDLRDALLQIEKSIGKNAIMKLGDNAIADVPGISTGVLSLDIALGGRGLPRGRIVEIYGPESSGKTTVALQAVANAQKQGGVAAFIDVEHALDPSWAKRLGVELDSLLVSQPSSGEDALKIAEMLIKSNAVDIIVLDSVAALVPESELKGEIGDAQVGAQARLMSQALRILNPVIGKTNVCMVFINQIRMKIGVMFGSPETTSGGQALKFYSSVRIEIRKSTPVKEGDETIGTAIKVKVVKNKVAPPFRKAEFDLLYDRGACLEADILTLAIDDGLISKSGGWHSYGDNRLANGRSNVINYLQENPELTQELKDKILEKRGMLAIKEPVKTEDVKAEAATTKSSKTEKAEKEKPTADKSAEAEKKTARSK